jgi:GT2 family glycosyltransferase
MPSRSDCLPLAPSEGEHRRVLPRISVVTPSLNQARFLERSLRSVLDQGYPDLEHVVMDGGSTDSSVEIIGAHAHRLAYWTSAPDGGQYDAINKGFARTTGEVMAWLNADDALAPWALHVVGAVFSLFPAIEWVTSLFPLGVSEDGTAISCVAAVGFNACAFRKGENLPRAGWYARSYIQQESTFWRRSLWDRAGGCVEPGYRCAGDFDLWARFFDHAELVGVASPLGIFRYHGAQKTARMRDVYVEEARAALRARGGCPRGRVSSATLRLLAKYVPPSISQRLAWGYPRPFVKFNPRQGSWEKGLRYAF